MAQASNRGGQPLSTHRGVEAALGFALILVALVVAIVPGDELDFSTLGLAATAGAGLALATLGVSATREGRGVSPSGHRVFDRVLIAAMLVVGVLLLLDDSRSEAIVLIGAAIVLVYLTVTTRYTSTGAD